MTDPLKVVSSDQPWYQEGLRFQCTECGQCCTGAPGYTWLSEKEIQEIASHLNLAVDEFHKCYVRLVNGRYSLRETLPHYDCIFLKDKKM